MALQDLSQYIFPLAIGGYFIWRFFKNQKIKKLLPDLIANGGVIVDVRSASEFAQGANPQSINIPLNELPSRCRELNREQTILLCCASGARSGLAVGILKKNGFAKVTNAGPWMNTVL